MIVTPKILKVIDWPSAPKFDLVLNYFFVSINIQEQALSTATHGSRTHNSLVSADPTLQYRVRYRPPSWVQRFRS